MNDINDQFDRWHPRWSSSWAWRVFKKHNVELLRMFTAFDNSKAFTYKELRKNGADWKDSPTQYFTFSRVWETEQFSSLKDWSKAFNQLENWVNLNALVAVYSCLETYLATVVPLALESDIGVLFGTPRRIDGIEILKHGRNKPFDFEAIVESCTKGTWQSRLNAYERAFGMVPGYALANISELEKMRSIRNNVAHAFGRDIEESRRIGEVTTLPISRLKRERFLKLQEVAWKVSKAIDDHLQNSHIGEYQALRFYHELYPTLNHDCHPSIRAMNLKKAIGKHGDVPAGKDFCKELVAYYEGL